LAGWIVLAACTSAFGQDAPAPTFESDVRPILAQHCLKCHGLEARRGGLDLRTASLARRGGDSGPAYVAHALEQSPLYQKVVERAMPPEGELPLTDEKIATLRRWIESGAAAEQTDDAAALADEATAADREHWAFHPLTRPAVPRVSNAAAARTPIDAFLLARLEEHGLSLAAETDRRTLIRRLSLDLVGLPPTPDEVQAFVDDVRPDAYERLVDRLLESPHFGERWARHWLDAAGYVDTFGADNDAAIIRPADAKWRYRDWVVRATNSDKPFDAFLIEQMAGDELVDWRAAEALSPEALDLLVATGFLRSVADRTAEDELNTADIRYPVLFDTLELVGTGVLGLTLQCARCHSHKYEPVSQREFYRLMACFTPAYNVQQWLQPEYREGTARKPQYRALADVAPVQQQAIDAHNATVAQQAANLRGEAGAMREACRARLADARFAAIPESLREDLRAAIAAPAESRNEVQRYLVEKLGPAVSVSDEEVAAALTEEERAHIGSCEQRAADAEATRRSYGVVQALYDVGPPPTTFLLRRGDYLNPAEPVEPGVLSVLDDPAAPLAMPAPQEGTATSGRRLALARWLVDPARPSGALTARVAVNRVWARLFGAGIVRTQGNFGRSGAPPSHPELLEFLASEFVRGGWRIKPLVRQIVSSAAYRQPAKVDAPTAQQADPDDVLLWRMRLRRLEAEIVRDSILAASGAIDRRLGGPPLPLDPRADGMVVLKQDALPYPGAQHRRSLYILCRRNYHLSLLDVFDQPVLATNCPERTPSAVVTQSLALLHDEFLLEHAGRMAARVLAESPRVGEAPAEPYSATTIAHAFEIALARPAADEEAAWCADFLARQAERHAAAGLPAEEAGHQALANLCHALLCSNEFLYVP
jgi:hypothetical protein